MTPLLPAPRIAGLLPAVCPRFARAPLDRAGQPVYTLLPGPGICITTSAGTFAVLGDDCVGESFAELVSKVGEVKLINMPLAG